VPISPVSASGSKETDDDELDELLLELDEDELLLELDEDELELDESLEVDDDELELDELDVSVDVLLELELDELLLLETDESDVLEDDDELLDRLLVDVEVEVDSDCWLVLDELLDELLDDDAPAADPISPPSSFECVNSRLPSIHRLCSPSADDELVACSIRTSM